MTKSKTVAWTLAVLLLASTYAHAEGDRLDVIATACACAPPEDGIVSLQLGDFEAGDPAPSEGARCLDFTGLSMLIYDTGLEEGPILEHGPSSP